MTFNKTIVKAHQKIINIYDINDEDLAQGQKSIAYRAISFGGYCFVRMRVAGSLFLVDFNRSAS